MPAVPLIAWTGGDRSTGEGVHNMCQNMQRGQMYTYTCRCTNMSANVPVRFVRLRVPSVPAALHSQREVPSLSAGAEGDDIGVKYIQSGGNAI